MQLFIIHCGFYDSRVNHGLYEGHTNFYIAAEDFNSARQKAKSLPEFKRLKMHIDGIQHIAAVDGYEIQLKEKSNLKGKTQIHSQKFGSKKEALLEFDPQEKA